MLFRASKRGVWHPAGHVPSTGLQDLSSVAKCDLKLSLCNRGWIKDPRYCDVFDLKIPRVEPNIRVILVADKIV